EPGEVEVDTAVAVFAHRLPRTTRPADRGVVQCRFAPAGVHAEVEPARPVWVGAFVRTDPGDRTTEGAEGDQGLRRGPAGVPGQQRVDRLVRQAVQEQRLHVEAVPGGEQRVGRGLEL